MRIQVGDLAKLYGLSSQTLHYYEKRGILKPKRDHLNQYRYFEGGDLSKLGTIKKTRNAQISLIDTIDVLKNQSEKDVVNLYMKQKQKLMEEIEEKMEIIRQIELDLSIYLKFKLGETQMKIGEMDEMWRFNSLNNEIIYKSRKEKEEAHPWFINIFHTIASERLDIDEEGNLKNYSFGMLATKEKARRLKLQKTKNVTIIEAGRCLLMTLDTNHKEDFHQAVKSGYQSILQNKYELREPPFTRTVFIYKKNDEVRQIKQIIFPIK